MSEGAAHADKMAALSQITGRLERLPFTSWQMKVLFFVGIATFFDAFDALSIAFALPALIGPWAIKPKQIGLLISASYVGQLFGALFFGWLADRIGRLRTLMLAILSFGILSFFCAFSHSYNSLLVCRLLQGLGLGGEVPVAASYINEIMKARSRGRSFLSYQMVFPVGLMMASFIGYWLVVHLGWRWLFVLGGAPSLGVLIILVTRGLPESPRWLASMGRLREAEQSMTLIEKNVRKALGADLPEPQAVVLPEATGDRASIGDLFRGIYLKRTITAWLIFFSAYLANYGVNTWLPSLFKTIYKLPTEKALLYTTVIFVVGFVSSLACVLLIDKIGRRAWIAGSLCLGGIGLVILWALGATSAGQVLLWTSLSYVFMSSVSITIFLYAPELYPTRMRAMGASVGSAWLRIAAIVGPLFVGMVITHYSLPWAFLFFGIVGLIGGLVTAFFGTETKGKVLEERISP